MVVVVVVDVVVVVNATPALDGQAAVVSRASPTVIAIVGVKYTRLQAAILSVVDARRLIEFPSQSGDRAIPRLEPSVGVGSPHAIVKLVTSVVLHTILILLRSLWSSFLGANATIRILREKDASISVIHTLVHTFVHSILHGQVCKKSTTVISRNAALVLLQTLVLALDGIGQPRQISLVQDGRLVRLAIVPVL